MEVRERATERLAGSHHRQAGDLATKLAPVVIEEGHRPVPVGVARQLPGEGDATLAGPEDDQRPAEIPLRDGLSGAGEEFHVREQEIGKGAADGEHGQGDGAVASHRAQLDPADADRSGQDGEGEGGHVDQHGVTPDDPVGVQDEVKDRVAGHDEPRGDDDALSPVVGGNASAVADEKGQKESGLDGDDLHQPVDPIDPQAAEKMCRERLGWRSPAVMAPHHTEQAGRPGTPRYAHLSHPPPATAGLLSPIGLQISASASGRESTGGSESAAVV